MHKVRIILRWVGAKDDDIASFIWSLEDHTEHQPKEDALWSDRHRIFWGQLPADNR